jgi:hypothetical protein
MLMPVLPLTFVTSVYYKIILSRQNTFLKKNPFFKHLQTENFCTTYPWSRKDCIYPMFVCFSQSQHCFTNVFAFPMHEYVLIILQCQYFTTDNVYFINITI